MRSYLLLLCFQILRPVTALLIIDVQNDFITGSLALNSCPAQHDGGAVVPVINQMLDTAKFDLVVYSCDWHPPDHISFIDCVKQRELHHTSQVSSAYLTVTRHDNRMECLRCLHVVVAIGVVREGGDLRHGGVQHAADHGTAALARALCTGHVGRSTAS